MSPPFRPKENQEVLWRVLQAGHLQTKQTNQSGSHRIVEIPSIPDRVTDARGVGTQSNIPRQSRVMEFRQRLDGDIDRKQMPEPAPDYIAERDQAALADGQIQHHVEAVAAFPIATSCCIAEDVDLGGRGQSEQFH